MISSRFTSTLNVQPGGMTFQKLCHKLLVTIMLIFLIFDGNAQQSDKGGATPTPAPARTPVPSRRYTEDQQKTSKENQSKEEKSKTEAGKTAASGKTPAKALSKTGTERKSEGPAKGASVPSKYVPPEFNIEANKEDSILYMDPIDIKVLVGQEFTTNLILANPLSHEFSKINIALKYNTGAISPLKVSASPLEPFISKKESMAVSNQGVLIFRATLAKPQKVAEMPLITIHWKALQEIKFSTIEFIDLDKTPSGIFNEESANILGNPEEECDGLLSATLCVETPLTEDMLEPMKSETGAGGITLKMQSRQFDDEKSGNTYVRVDILLNNPRKIAFNLVDLQLKFDPAVLQAIDWDENNWITTGNNIYDGAYHEDFPFDYHIANQFTNGIGDIVYKMGSLSEQAAAAGEKILASMLFIVKKRGGVTTISFKMPQNQYQDGTRITSLGIDALGNPQKMSDGTENLQISP